MTKDTKAGAEEAVVKELQGRVEEFNKELIPLLGKYELGLGASAFINPNGTVGARPIMFDAKKKPEEKPADVVESTEPAKEEGKAVEGKVVEGEAIEGEVVEG